MEKTISAFEARRQFGKVLDDVGVRGDVVVVERHGEPAVAIVPMRIYKRMKADREAFFARAQAISERADLPADEAEALVADAIAEARAERRHPVAQEHDALQSRAGGDV
jgi:prevent-host-death family protein